MSDQLAIACSLGATDLRARLAEMTQLGKSAFVDAQRAPEHAEIRFTASPGVRDRLETIAALESKCCAFLTLRISDEPDLVVLHIGAPSGAEPVLEELVAAFQSDDPWARSALR
jgi:hypothetical protein